MPLHPVTAKILTKLSIRVAEETITGATKGFLLGWKAADQLTAGLYLNLVYFFATQAANRDRINRNPLYALDTPRFFISEFNRFRSLYPDLEHDEEAFETLLSSSVAEPNRIYLAEAIFKADHALIPVKLTVYSASVAVGMSYGVVEQATSRVEQVKGAVKKVRNLLNKF